MSLTRYQDYTAKPHHGTSAVGRFTDPKILPLRQAQGRPPPGLAVTTPPTAWGAWDGSFAAVAIYLPV